MTNAVPSFFPDRVNMHIPNMEFDAGVQLNNKNRFELGVYVTADADGILDGQDTTAAGEALFSEGDFNVLYSHSVMGRYGRNVTAVASTTNTDALNIFGFDYLGQPIQETLTLNSGTPVAGKKAFARVTKVVWLAEAATLDVGWGNVLGLPYASIKMFAEYVSGVVTGNAGTFTAAVRTDPQTATTGDPRGTYATHATDVPNGTRSYAVVCDVFEGDLHGIPHYSP